MSTKLTRYAPKSGQELVDSHALALTHATTRFQQNLVAWLLTRLAADGFEGVSASQLSLLGELDCGPNHAAQLARKLGVTRQAIHKSIRELEAAGWLQTRTDADLGNQKVIEFTEEGERMMAAARRHFADLDALLLKEFGIEGLEMVQRFLAVDLA